MADDPPACRNCGHALPDPPLKYCPACGQETALKPPTLLEFAQQFGGAYISTEGAMWRTLKTLLRPGELTREYFAGRRRRYVLPLRLYLTISVVVLLAFRLIASASIESEEAVKVEADKPINFRIDLVRGRAGLRDGVFFCEDLPAWVCKRVQRRVDVQPERAAEAARALGERFVGNVGAAMFLLLPGFAAGLKLVYRNRRLRYTEHLVFALHVHAFWFLVAGLTLLPLGGYGQLLWLVVPPYTLWAMRRVYGGRWRWLLARASLLSLGYLVLLSMAMLAIVLWSVIV